MTAVTLLAFLTVSCGSGYRPPLLAPATFSYQIAGTKDRLFDKAINALSQLDFEVVIQDRVGGQIRTMPKQMNLQPSECDCGAYYTKEFIKDPLTTVSVEVVIDIQDGMLKFATRMSGAHKNSLARLTGISIVFHRANMRSISLNLLPGGPYHEDNQTLSVLRVAPAVQPAPFIGG